MAKVNAATKAGVKLNSFPHRRTSIGRSANTRPTNKHKRRSYKKYRGQG